MTTYETVIGLEVHAQLSTQSKLFCRCSTEFGKSANANTCEVCLGMPGVLPVLNQHAVELAVRAAKGLACTVHLHSQWSRKNYFYPDLPKGYQISQYDKPIATLGKLTLEDNKEIRITRIHMEEDAGKNVHDDMLAGERSYVDFNRSSIPLIEIVSEPDLRSSEEAVSYLKTLRQVLRYLEVCDGNMEEGSLRCDANVSIRLPGAPLGTRVELKNINSFKFVQQAIDYEVMRQQEVIESGGTIKQETRLWDTQAKVTRSMRSKEDAHDYRYFPDPDLPPLTLEQSFVENIHLPELPHQKVQRYTTSLGLSAYDAKILTDDSDIARFFEAVVQSHSNVKAIANWIINELLRELKGQHISALKFPPQALAELVMLIDDNTISGKIAKDVFVDMFTTGESPKAIVEKKGLKQVTDTSTLEPLVDEILSKNADSVQKLKEGKTNILGFLVGLVIKASNGKANPKLVNELIRKKLE